MPVSHHQYTEVQCEVVGCGERHDFPFFTIADTKRKLREQGWKITRDGRTFCPKHKSEDR